MRRVWVIGSVSGERKKRSGSLMLCCSLFFGGGFPESSLCGSNFVDKGKYLTGFSFFLLPRFLPGARHAVCG